MVDATLALRELATWAATASLAHAPAHVAPRVDLVLRDHLGVTVAGASTPEGRQLLDALEAPEGPAPLVATGRGTTVDLAAWVHGTLACSLELDEGNKYARGHPAVHAYPAVLAEAAARCASGRQLFDALLVAYEVGSRAGAATRLRRGLHPHGSWGALGAAAGVARLRGFDAQRTAAALDAAAGLVLAAPFASATDGNLVRNAWVGHTNQAGLHAVRLAAAGWARPDRTVELTLGNAIGELDTTELTADLGARWHVTEGYFKRHASCSFTHPPVDAVLELRADRPALAYEVAHVEVATHALASGLDSHQVNSRLSAMFSIPFAVAVALVHGDASPARFEPTALQDPQVVDLATRITVVEDHSLTGELPANRGARVTVTTRQGETLVRSVPNPVGDADHHPFTRADVDDKLRRLLGDIGHATVVDVVDGLAGAPDVSVLLHRLR